MISENKDTVRNASNSSEFHGSTGSLYSGAFELHDGESQHNIHRLFSKLYLNKIDIYHVLERQEGSRTLAYHLFVFLLTLISLIFGSISTIDECRPILDKPLYYLELGLSIFFTFELLLRIWSAGCRTKYRTFSGRFIFATRWVILLDIITLLGFVMLLGIGMNSSEFSSLTLKFLLPLQMIRFLRVDRQLLSWTILKGTILQHGKELKVTLVIAFTFLITGSYLVYVTETPVDSNLSTGPFRSAADTLWFSIITVICLLFNFLEMTTIGFGDLYPTTYIAKMITTTVCFLGIAFWCLPAGIIGSGLAIKVQEQKRDDAFNRLVPAAASVIRNWWRLRCAYQGNRFVSTWKIYKLVQRRVNYDNISTNTNDVMLYENGVTTNTTLPSSKTSNFRQKSIASMDDLPKRYILAIKVIRTLKYCAICKKFQEAKRPIDLKDIAKENIRVHNRLSIMLSDIQRRLDLILGKTKSVVSTSSEEKRKVTLSSRIEKLEQITNDFEKQLSYLEQLASQLMENTTQ